MKKYTYVILAALGITLSGCDQEPSNKMKFAVCADYPPFEYYIDGKISGFDIELAQLIAKELGKEAVFEDMQFSAIFAALKNSMVDAGISTITATEDRKQNFNFSENYYMESLATVYKKRKPFTEKFLMEQAKIACQLGSSMEIWLKKNIPNAEIVTMDKNNEIIEALKAGRVDCALIDSVQGMAFCKKNPGLNYSEIEKTGNGYSIAVKKGSPLIDKINSALQSLETKREIQKLKQKWLEGNTWKN